MKKKTHPTFNVPNYGAPNRKRVRARWRFQRGIDSKKRVKRSGYGASPSIGYKNSAEFRYARSDGRHEELIHNERELLTLVGKKDIVARFSHDLSRRKRLAMQSLADKRAVTVVNRVD